MLSRRVLRVFAFSAVLLLAPAIVWADVAQLTIPNSDLWPYPGPYADVNVEVASGIATFTLTGLSAVVGSDAYQYLVGGQGIFAFNLSQDDTTGLTFTWLTNPDDFRAVYFNRTVDGFGIFDVVIKWFDGFGHAVPELQFTVTREGGFTGVADVFQANEYGHHYASHIFVKDLATGSAVVTGYATDGAIPEPWTLTLAAAGLLLIGRKLRGSGTF